MVRSPTIALAIGLVLVLGAGVLLASSAQAQPTPAHPRAGQQLCQSVLPAQTTGPIIAKYRDRLRTARVAAVREELALRSLLIADSSTRAAVEAQMAKAAEARNTLTRVRVDVLWELRGVVPVQDRDLALRCAQRLLLRGR